MNNLTIGGTDRRTGRQFAYYETVAGGMGARAGLDGLDAIHTHMTNSLNTPAEAMQMFRDTGCDMVMIGRASMKNPWIFQQCAAELAGRPWSEPTAEQRRDLILEHFRLLVAGEDEKTAFHKIRTFAGWYTHGLPGVRGLRQRINGIPDSPTFIRAVEEFFEELLAAPDLAALAEV